MLLRPLLPLFAVLMLASPAGAAEEVITFEVDGETVAGTLNIPEGGPGPVVLMFHGFGGTRDEESGDGGVFSRTAARLAEHGYASLRIDFRGVGASDGEFYDTTFERQVADGLAALAFVTAEPRVDATRLALIGWSQGGLVASAVAGRSDAPDAVALWAAVASPVETYTAIFGAENIAAGLQAGDEPYEARLPWGGVIIMRRPFFEGVTTFSPTDEIASYEGPLFVAQGTLDTTVLPHSADAFLAAHEGEEESWIVEMDHVFNLNTGDPATLDAMIAATIAFLDKHV